MKKVSILCVVLLIVTIAFLCFIKGNIISKDEVKRIVINDISADKDKIHFSDIDLVYEEKVYEVEVIYENKKYEYKIDFKTGKVLYTNFDALTLQEEEIEKEKEKTTTKKVTTKTKKVDKKKK